MTNVLDENEIIEEVTVKLRNANIFTITQRGVTTTTQTGTLTGATSILIPLTTVKNIRTITMDDVAINFGSNYIANYEDSTGCIITLTSATTATYSVSYDYGADKIHPDYQRSDLQISSYPRIGIGIIDIVSETGGFGNVNENRYDLSVIVYDTKKNAIRNYIKAIRTFLIDNIQGFYYLKVVKPTLMGPVVVHDADKTKDRILKQNIDFRSILNLEKN